MSKEQVAQQIAHLNQQVVQLYYQGRYEQAIRLATRARDLIRQHLGKDHPQFATSLNGLAELYASMGNYAAAEPLYRQALEINRAALGDNHPDFAAGLNRLANLYRLMGNSTAAEPLFRQALEINRAALGDTHPEYAGSLNNLGVLYASMGNYAAAEPLYRQALEIRRAALGETHSDLAASLNNLAMLYVSMGNYAAAEPLYHQALEVYRVALGDNHPDLANCLSNLAVLYASMGNYAAAEPLLRQRHEIYRVAVGENHPNFAASLDGLAEFYRATGNYAAAEPLYRQLLEIRRVALGDNHPQLAPSLSILAGLYESMGDYAAAERLYRQALEISRAALGDNHPGFATGLDRLADMYRLMGNYAAAEPLYRQALEINRAALGDNHPQFAGSLNNLAVLYQSMGNYAAAEPLCRQALEINRAFLGDNHAKLAHSLNILVVLYQSMGNYAAAEPLLRQALEIDRGALRDNDPSVAASLNNLARLYWMMGDYAAAEPLYRQALEIHRAALGETHLDFAANLNNLAVLSQSMGNFAAAEPLYRQALEINRAALGDNHPEFAGSLNNLAGFYRLMGNYAAAEPLCRQALEIRRVALGDTHPYLADSLENLAGLHVALGRQTEALPLMRQAAMIDDRAIGQVFSIGSDRQRLAFLQTIQGRTARFLSLIAQHLRQSPEAVLAALELVLRRKAIRAEALAAQRDAVLGGKYPDLEPRLRQWASLRMQIAQKTLAGPGPEGLKAHQQQLAEWTSRNERLEADLARQIPEMNLEQQLRKADRRAVALALGEGVSLVEFVRFHVVDFKAVAKQLSGSRWEPPSHWRPARYLAFVLSAREPDNVQLFDLGEAEPIDRLIADFRSSITGETQGPSDRNMVKRRPEPGPTTTDDSGSRLRTAVFDKLIPAIREHRRLLLAPDGDLTRLPFEVLPSDDGRRLIDVYQISYLGTGRDVLRFSAASTGQSADPVVISDPDFDLTAETVAGQRSPSAPPKTGFWSRWFGGRKAVPAVASRPASTPRKAGEMIERLSRDFNRSQYHFGRLPGTRMEGERIAALLGVQAWLDTAALEGRLKQTCRSPRILHLATHGFFLQDQPHDPNQHSRDLGLPRGAAGGPGRLSGPLPENPLLRSGLALAGANTWLRQGTPPAEAEDGLLTAEDVSGMDLLATELVVLSACETGLGEVHTGEGVFGLQRAFVLAGAKTLVMSLWSVPDQQTQELMEDFHQRILNGQPRADALREAQLALKARYPDPFYWGAFICQGNPGPLP
jgi:tetratricopeptide (TPR) repeat protein